ncbi:MAG: NAD-dependent epimerase/dehydratase family protein [Myxococcota bacterium]
MKYLITGGTGFIGSSSARRILADGDEVHLFVRDADAVADDLSKACEVFVGTIGDPNAIAAAAAGCEVVVHAAAAPNHRCHPRALQWINVAGTENVVNAARSAGVARVVYLSCADVTLTNADRVNWNEARELTKKPFDAHARSKLLGEEVALTANSAAMEVTALRPTWVWGPGDTSRLPHLAREALGGGIQLVGSGGNLIASIYIDNLIEAILLAAEAPEAAGQRYYVSEGDFIEAGEFFSMLSTALGAGPPRTGPPYPIAFPLASLGRRVGGQALSATDIIQRGRSSLFDVQNLVKDLDWGPTVAMADGATKLQAWIAAQGGAEAVAALERAPATAESVDAQVEAAGGD